MFTLATSDPVVMVFIYLNQQINFWPLQRPCSGAANFAAVLQQPYSGAAAALQRRCWGAAAV